MKTKPLALLLVLLATSLAHASPVTTDYIDAPDGLVIRAKKNSITVPSNAATHTDNMIVSHTSQQIYNKDFDNSSNVKNQYSGIWDYSVSGGELGSYSLGITIPANAYVTKFIIDAITAPGSSASPTIRFDAENSGDMLLATSFSNISAGLSIGRPGSGSTLAAQIASGVKMTAASAVNMVVASGKLSTGKIRVFVETLEE